ncbi:MMPL family transporter [Pyruvatibacter sp.]|uniref:MMPL family transporter n=1 Tax=Pyruvatibacter sp. TaxID=1981328 RepID=UPI0032EF6A30
MSRFLATIVGAITRHPRTTLVGLLLVTLLAAWFAVTHFRVNADQASLIAPNAEFQVRFDAFREAFPAYKRTTLVVVEAASRSAARSGAIDLAQALATRDDLYRDVFTTAASPFFQTNGLLYLDTPDIAAQLDAVVEAQPGIAIATDEKGLGGLLTLLRQGTTQLDETGNVNPALLTLARDLTRAATAFAADDNAPIRLSLGTAQAGTETAIELITIQIREDATDFLSPRAKLDVIRQTATDLGLTPEAGYRIRLTGNIPLSVEELTQVRDSLGLAGALSFAMLAIVLGFGVRSARIVSVLVLTLVLGGVWSMAWAMLSIGEVNLLSASFAILFVGLGIDFAIHLALRAQEDVEAGMGTPEALTAAAGDVGPAIALGALTSAIGFLAFLPTDYKGFADLGVIAGGGMALAFIAAITVIPASLAAGGVPHQRRAGEKFSAVTAGVFAVVERHARTIVIAAIAIGLASAAIATRASFDFSTLALKNAQSEPIEALADLQQRGLVTDYAAYVVVPSLEEVDPIAQRLTALPTVASVRTAAGLIPADQSEKLLLIEDAAFLLFPLKAKLNAPAAPVPADLSLSAPDTTDAQTRTAYAMLEAALAALPSDALIQFNARVAAQVTRELEMLLAVLDARPVTSLDQVPPEILDRYISPSGAALVIGLPAGDVTRTSELNAFVRDVKSAFPDSTGRAVVEATVGDIVVNAFITALVLALSAVTIIIFMATRSLADTALILMPLLLAALATTATGVLIGMPFNQANIIVLPLIMGLGVDNGIHVLMRYRQDGSLDRLMTSSTPRAIILSTLTTIGAFGALGISVHAGTASIGILLTIAMVFLLIATVFVLPAALSLRHPRSHAHPAA